MACSIEDVRAIAPEVAEVEIAAIERAITLASYKVSATRMGQAKADLAQAFFAAHLIAVAYPEKIKPNVTAEAFGGVSHTFGAGGPSLGADRFESEYMKLCREAGFGGNVL